MNSPAEATPEMFSVDSPMDALLAAWPGARRALFARYHIGGCSSCGFQPGESLAAVCTRHDVDPAEALAHLREAAAADAALLISPPEAKRLLEGGTPPALIDLRTREEHDAVALPGSLFFTEDLQREAFATWEKDRAIILYDHTGNRSLDMAAWFVGHGLRATRALAGGIDAWSREVDRTVPRYRIEMES